MYVHFWTNGKHWRLPKSFEVGQIFGTGGDRVVVLEQPKYGTGMFKEGGFGVDDLPQSFAQFLKLHLEPVGLMKRPYPFYDGVKPPAKKNAS